jgi:cellulose synthase/poly-beta-1,6-N-acetylglucosamine synthase-like glycosyltransferase
MNNQMSELKPMEQHMILSETDLTIILCSRNEPLEISIQTIENFKNNKIIVVDNSDKFPIEWSQYVKNINGTFIHHNNTKDKKAGNVDVALSLVTTQYVLFLDVDSKVSLNDVLCVMDFFRIEQSCKYSFIQIQTTSQCDSQISLIGQSQSVYQTFRNKCIAINEHFSLFYGHNAIWRTKCLKKFVQYDSKQRLIQSEDLYQTLMTYKEGFFGCSLLSNQTFDGVPLTLKSTIKQWRRWCSGSYQVLMMFGKDFLMSNNVSLKTKFQFLTHLAIYWRIPFVTLMLILICFSIFKSFTWYNVISIIFTMSIYLLPEIWHWRCLNWKKFYLHLIGKICADLGILVSFICGPGDWQPTKK